MTWQRLHHHPPPPVTVLYCLLVNAYHNTCSSSVTWWLALTTQCCLWDWTRIHWLCSWGYIMKCLDGCMDGITKYNLVCLQRSLVHADRCTNMHTNTPTQQCTHIDTHTHTPRVPLCINRWLSTANQDIYHWKVIIKVVCDWVRV